MAVLQVLLALIAVGLTVVGQGEFPLGGDTPTERLQLVQLFLSTFSLTGMVLAAAVSERKRAVDVVRESEADHRTILLAALAGFWRTDMQGRILEVNQSYCRMSGCSEPELLRMRISDLDGVDTPDEVIARIRSQSDPASI